jgi:hypothetical protein
MVTWCRCECHKIYATGPRGDEYCMACTTDYADRCEREQPERRATYDAGGEE